MPSWAGNYHARQGGAGDNQEEGGGKVSKISLVSVDYFKPPFGDTGKLCSDVLIQCEGPLAEALYTAHLLSDELALENLARAINAKVNLTAKPLQGTVAHFEEMVTPTPERVIFHDPATIVYWNDGTKTVVKCDPRDTYRKETGLAMCYMKKVLGSSRAFNDVLKEWAGKADEE